MVFDDDVPGDALCGSADEVMWYKEIFGREKMRIFYKASDEGYHGDTFLYGYHSDGSGFVARIMDYYQQMIERCQ